MCNESQSFFLLFFVFCFFPPENIQTKQNTARSPPRGMHIAWALTAQKVHGVHPKVPRGSCPRNVHSLAGLPPNPRTVDLTFSVVFFFSQKAAEDGNPGPLLVQSILPIRYTQGPYVSTTPPTTIVWPHWQSITATATRPLSLCDLGRLQV